MTDQQTIEALTKALEEIRDRANLVCQAGDAAARRMLVENYNTANIALMRVGKAK